MFSGHPPRALGLALLLAACAPGASSLGAPAPCSAAAECGVHDGARVSLTGIYRVFPDRQAVPATDVPRAARIELSDGPGPFLEPYWSKRAVRSEAEIARLDGRRVRVVGIYHKEMPKHPTDPPQASAMGGPCVEVESLDLAP